MGKQRNKRKKDGKKKTASKKMAALAGRTSRTSRSAKKTVGAVMKEGVLRKTRRGFGFVSMEDSDDIFVAARHMNGAMDGDFVRISLRRDRRNADQWEGYVEEILRRGVTELVGTFQPLGRTGLVIPEDRRMREGVLMPKGACGKAKKGDKVLVFITKYPENEDPAEGKVVEIISRAEEIGGDIKALVRAFGLFQTFPEKVMVEAKTLPSSADDVDIRPNEDDKMPRRDLRDRRIFTIDGADARDFDDAVSIEKLDNGNYLLGVHIADVSHYVTEDSALDKEALHRGTSVYLPGVVVPMLPESLSNGICSLMEKTDRLTLSINMEISKEGDVVAHEIFESVIHSAARLVYDDVSDLLEGGRTDEPCPWSFLKEDLFLMKDLAEILSRKRDLRGSIDFDLDEASIHLDDFGAAVEITRRDRRVANRLIEEFMLLTNETVAERFYFSRLPFVYRVHPRPEAEKMTEFQAFVAEIGWKLNGDPGGVRPRELSRLLQELEDKPEERIVSTVLLRAMQKAIYSTECAGHFGLALKYYCHFTSPIRRYPDLVIHRVIKESLKGEIPVRRRRKLVEKMAAAASRSSDTEQNAVALEREAEKMKKAELMEGQTGCSFEAVISGVASFGLFATLENTVEGFIPIGSLREDYFTYEPKRYRLIGEHTDQIYALGDRIRVIVDSVDRDSREILFRLDGRRTGS